MGWPRRKKDQPKTPKVNKENLENFLEQITTSIDENFSGRESNQLEQLMRKELDTWLDQTVNKNKPLDMISVKVGVCIGILESLRKINETEEKERVTYIA